MNRLHKVFNKQKFFIIGMVHVDPLPGTPKYKGNWNKIIEKAKHEAHVYSKYNLDSILIENMHDIPYIKNERLGPEIIACMTQIANEVKSILIKNIPCGIQILACGNKQAIAVAKACNLQYIRAEGFVFGHIGDEGYTDACAGDLLRYRKQIDAENVLVFTDLKKKHSSHAITEDINLLDTAKAAEFFSTDGIIITGNSTGQPASQSDVLELLGKVNSPILIGSGVTIDNVDKYFNYANGSIIGSHFKVDGNWRNDLCETSISEFMRKVKYLRKEIQCNNILAV